MKKATLPSVFVWRYLACPLTIGWIRTSHVNVLKEVVSTETWKAAYIFGLRVAMWRPEGG